MHKLLNLITERASVAENNLLTVETVVQSSLFKELAAHQLVECASTGLLCDRLIGLFLKPPPLTASKIARGRGKGELARCSIPPKEDKH